MLPLYETWLKGLEEGVPVRNILDTDKLMETFGARVTTVSSIAQPKSSGCPGDADRPTAVRVDNGQADTGHGQRAT